MVYILGEKIINLDEFKKSLRIKSTVTFKFKNRIYTGKIKNYTNDNKRFRIDGVKKLFPKAVLN